MSLIQAPELKKGFAAHYLPIYLAVYLTICLSMYIPTHRFSHLALATYMYKATVCIHVCLPVCMYCSNDKSKSITMSRMTIKMA